MYTTNPSVKLWGQDYLTGDANEDKNQGEVYDYANPAFGTLFTSVAR